MSSTDRINQLWKMLEKKPAGKLLFSKILSRMVPYTGSVSPYVEKLEKGFCRVSMKDRKSVRNHLNSVHALALANLGELSSGLAMITQLGSDFQGIVTGLSINYLKKARGQIVAEAKVSLPALSDSTDVEVESLLYDAQRELVAKLKVQWSVRRRPS